MINLSSFPKIPIPARLFAQPSINDNISMVQPPPVESPIQSRSVPVGFSNSPMLSVNLSQYLQWPTTLPGPFWLPSIPSHLSLTSCFVLILDLAASSMICRSNGIRPRITSMASVGVDLSAPEIASKIFLCICFNLSLVFCPCCDPSK